MANIRTLFGDERAQFDAALLARNLVPPKDVIADGKWHRCNTRNKNGRGDGSYIVFANGTVPAGGLQNFQDNLGWHKWCYHPKGRTFTPAEDAEVTAKVEAARERRDAVVAAEHAHAAAKSRRLWDAATPVTTHPYLERKHVKAHGVRALHNCLIVPVRDEEGRIVSIHWIRVDGTKCNAKGGRMRGCYFSINGTSSSVIVCEGFATAASLHEATGATVFAALSDNNLVPVAEAVRKQHPSAIVTIAADDDHKKGGNPGLTWARKAARAASAKVARPDFGSNRRDKDTDFNDLADLLDIDHVKQSVAQAKAPNELLEDLIKADPHSTLKHHAGEISELKKQDCLAFDRLRTAAKVAGLRHKVFDEVVDEAHKEENDDDEHSRDELQHWKVEPWPNPVAIAPVLDEIVALLKTHIVLPKHAAETAALWCLHTWCLDVLDVSPYLAILSPVKGCGKTSLLGLLNWLTRRSEIASNISPAAVFRFIELYHPTLLIDEADSFVRENEELRGILNSGHTRIAAYVIRCDGDSLRPRRFSTWAPKAFSLIGRLPETLEDRSITILMAKKTDAEEVKRVRRARDCEQYQTLRRKMARWARDNMPALSDPPEIMFLSDRAMDNWRPLMSIAVQAGGGWPERASQAAIATVSTGVGALVGVKVELLRDIKMVFEQTGKDKIASKELASLLAADEEGPWHSYGRSGKELTPKQLGSLLRPFIILSKTLHPPGQADVKGYERVDFDDAFARYLPKDPPKPSGEKPDPETIPACAQCNAADGTRTQYGINGKNVWLHRECVPYYRQAQRR